MSVRLNGFAAGLVVVAVSGAAVSVPSDAVADGSAKVGVSISPTVKAVKPTAKNQPPLSSSGVKKLKAKKTYTTPLAGTKKHKISFTQVVNQFITLKVKVDGKVSLTIKAKSDSTILETNDSYELSLVQVDGQTTLLFVHNAGVHAYDSGTFVYKYVSGKFSTVSNLSKLTGFAAAYGAVPINAGNSQFTVQWEVSNMQTIGNHDAKIAYSFVNGKVKLISNNYTPVFTFSRAGRPVQTGWKGRMGTLTRSVKAYIAPNATAVAFKVGKGTKVRILRVKLGKKSIYIKVQKTIKNVKKVGWIDIKNYKTRASNGHAELFKEAVVFE